MSSNLKTLVKKISASSLTLSSFAVVWSVYGLLQWLHVSFVLAATYNVLVVYLFYFFLSYGLLSVILMQGNRFSRRVIKSNVSTLASTLEPLLFIIYINDIVSIPKIL